METQEAILSADAAADERFNMSESIVMGRIRSMLCAPRAAPSVRHPVALWEVGWRSMVMACVDDIYGSPDISVG
jgi:hypothetical protein